MKISQFNKWRMKQQKIFQKYMPKVRIKFRRKQDNFKGKFVLVLSPKYEKCGAVLKFESSNLCQALWAIPVSTRLLKMTAQKYIIRTEKYKKLHDLKVKISKNFRKDLFDVWKNVYNGAEDKKKRKQLSKKKRNRSTLNSLRKGTQLIEEFADEYLSPQQASAVDKEDYKLEGIDYCEMIEEDDPVIDLIEDDEEEKNDSVVDLIEDDVEEKDVSVVDLIEDDVEIADTITIESPISNGASFVVDEDDEEEDLLIEIPDPKRRQPKKKVTPIKIISCKKPGCKEKFTSILALNSHLSTHIDKIAPKTQIPPKVDDSDESGNELFIDEDVELVLEENCMSYNITSHAPLSNGFFPIKKEEDQVLDKKLVCDICGEEFSRTSGLHAHKKISHNSDNNANKRTQTRHAPRQNGIHQSSRDNNSIYLFRRYDTNKVDFICRICSNNFGQRSHLDRHVQTFHVTKIYVCLVCNSDIVSSIDVEGHLNTFHSQLKIGEMHSRILNHVYTYRCPFCIFRSKDRQLVTEHMIHEHYDEFEKNEDMGSNMSASPDLLENLLEPESVDKIEMRLEELKAERIITMSLNSKKNGICKHRCGKCKKVFETREDIRSHECSNRKILINQPNPFQQSTSTFQCEPSTYQQTPELPKILEPPATKMSFLTSKRHIFSQRVNGFHLCKCNKVFTNKQLFDEHHMLEHLAL